MRLACLFFPAMLLVATASHAQPAQSPGWQAMDVSDPATSISTGLLSSDGRSYLTVRCQNKRLTIQFLPKTATGIGDLPVMTVRGQSRDNYPFQLRWTRVEDRMAYLDPVDNRELAQVLAGLFAFGNETMVVTAKDAKGAPLQQEFHLPSNQAEPIEAVVRKCHDGKGIQELDALKRAWSLENGTAGDGKPVYTAWLNSPDNRARIGVRCTYANGGMDAVLVLHHLGGILDFSQPQIQAGGDPVAMTFRRSGEEWEYEGDYVLPFVRYMLSARKAFLLRFPGSYWKAGTMFITPTDESRAQVHQAVRMCNIPL